jgi:hypothetical protein
MKTRFQRKAFMLLLITWLTVWAGLPCPALGEREPSERGGGRLRGPEAPRERAMPAWVEGEVTTGPWRDRYRHIQVDGKTYTLMSDIRISERYESRPGAFLERQLSFSQIRKGQRIMMRVAGFRVYQILIYD